MKTSGAIEPGVGILAVWRDEDPEIGCLLGDWPRETGDTRFPGSAVEAIPI